MLYAKVRNYEIRALAKKDLDKMVQLMDTDDYKDPEFQNYFHLWMQEGTGLFYFPKEKHFVSRDGVKNYALALLQYGSRMAGLKDVVIERK